MLKLTTEDKNNDNHSKFPEVIVIPLKDFSAKATKRWPYRNFYAYRDY